MIKKTLLAMGVAAAFAAPAQAAAPTLGEVLKASGITVSGVVDVSYDYKDVDQATGLFGNGISPHVFDTNPNTFSLHQVNLLISKDFGNGVSLTLNPILGDDAALINGTVDTNGDTVPGNDFNLFQGFVSYNTGALTVSAGRQATLAGYEVVNSGANANASRSLLFFGQPLAHTGVRASYKLSDALAVTLGVHNSGVGVGKTDADTRKTLEAQIAFTPSSSVALYLTSYYGEGDGNVLTSILGVPPGFLNDQTSSLFDFVATFKLNDMLSFGANVDYGTLEDTQGGQFLSQGVAGYTTVNISSKLSVSLRGEYAVLDTGPANIGDIWFREATVTAAYSLTDSLKLLAEVRNDKVDSLDGTGFDGGIFSPRDVTTGGGNNDINSATLKAILKF